jgi:transposase
MLALLFYDKSLLMPDNTELEQLQKQLVALQAQVDELQQDNLALNTRIAQLLAELKLSKSKKYGKQSEKGPRGTFNEAEQAQSESTPNHHKKGKRTLPANLPREDVDHKLTDTDCVCCGEQMHICGTQDSEQVKIIPAKISVIKHRQFKYSCRHCEHTELSNKIVTAPKPKQPIPGSMASPETLAAVVTAKYCDAVPLNRQVEVFKRGGLTLSRGTLANWCIQASHILKPLVVAMQQHLLAQHSICADETRVQVLDEPDKTATSQSYMWVYRSNEMSKQPVVIYDYQAGRGRACLMTFLGDYQGYLQCDGYKVYENIANVIAVSCWAHARRKYDEALKAESKNKGRGHKAISFIGKLYRLEAQAKKKNLTSEERYQLRQEKAKPILAAFKHWLDETQTKVTKKSYIGIAIEYTINQWDKLIRYIEDGELGIDNNITERDIRPFTTGRKNWMFSQSVNGAEASAIFYSIVMTCRANDINPYYYFRHLFKALPNLGEGSDISDFLPWNVQLDFDSS